MRLSFPQCVPAYVLLRAEHTTVLHDIGAACSAGEPVWWEEVVYTWSVCANERPATPGRLLSQWGRHVTNSICTGEVGIIYFLTFICSIIDFLKVTWRWRHCPYMWTQVFTLQFSCLRTLYKQQLEAVFWLKMLLLEYKSIWFLGCWIGTN